MQVIVTTQIKFDNWEISYLKLLGMNEITKYMNCELEIDPIIFTTKDAQMFKLGYEACEDSIDYSDY